MEGILLLALQFNVVGHTMPSLEKGIVLAIAALLPPFRSRHEPLDNYP